MTSLTTRRKEESRRWRARRGGAGGRAAPGAHLAVLEEAERSAHVRQVVHALHVARLLARQLAAAEHLERVEQREAVAQVRVQVVHEQPLRVLHRRTITSHAYGSRPTTTGSQLALTIDWKLKDVLPLVLLSY